MQHILYDISQRFDNLKSALEIADDKESIQAISQALQKMDVEISETVYNGIGYIKNLEAFEKGMEDEIKRLQMKQKALRNRISRIREGYREFLTATGQKTVKTERGSMTVSPAGSRAVKVTNETIIPEKYLIVVPEHIEPCMPEIRKALKAGEEIPGVQYEEPKQSLRIS